MEILRVYLKEQSQVKYYVVKHLILQKNPKYDGYQRRLASMVYTFFIKLLLIQTKKQDLILA